MTSWALGSIAGPAIGGGLADPCTAIAALQRTAACAQPGGALRRLPFLPPFAVLAAAAVGAALLCACAMSRPEVVRAMCEEESEARASPELGAHEAADAATDAGEQAAKGHGGSPDHARSIAGRHSTDGVKTPRVLRSFSSANSSIELPSLPSLGSGGGAGTVLTKTAARDGEEHAAAAADEQPLLDDDAASHASADDEPVTSSLDAKPVWWRHRCVLACKLARRFVLVHRFVGLRSADSGGVLGTWLTSMVLHNERSGMMRVFRH